jgi:hypothetical protein
MCFVTEISILFVSLEDISGSPTSNLRRKRSIARVDYLYNDWIRCPSSFIFEFSVNNNWIHPISSIQNHTPFHSRSQRSISSPSMPLGPAFHLLCISHPNPRRLSERPAPCDSISANRFMTVMDREMSGSFRILTSDVRALYSSSLVFLRQNLTQNRLSQPDSVRRVHKFFWFMTRWRHRLGFLELNNDVPVLVLWGPKGNEDVPVVGVHFLRPSASGLSLYLPVC